MTRKLTKKPVKRSNKARGLGIAAGVFGAAGLVGLGYWLYNTQRKKELNEIIDTIIPKDPDESPELSPEENIDVEKAMVVLKTMTDVVVGDTDELNQAIVASKEVMDQPVVKSAFKNALATVVKHTPTAATASTRMVKKIYDSIYHLPGGDLLQKQVLWKTAKLPPASWLYSKITGVSQSEFVSMSEDQIRLLDGQLHLRKAAFVIPALKPFMDKAENGLGMAGGAFNMMRHYYRKYGQNTGTTTEQDQTIAEAAYSFITFTWALMFISLVLGILGYMRTSSKRMLVAPPSKTIKPDSTIEIEEIPPEVLQIEAAKPDNVRQPSPTRPKKRKTMPQQYDKPPREHRSGKSFK